MNTIGPSFYFLAAIGLWLWAVLTCRTNAAQKGRSVYRWTVASLILGPLGVFLLNTMPSLVSWNLWFMPDTAKIDGEDVYGMARWRNDALAEVRFERLPPRITFETVPPLPEEVTIKLAEFAPDERFAGSFKD